MRLAAVECMCMARVDCRSWYLYLSEILCFCVCVCVCSVVCDPQSTYACPYTVCCCSLLLGHWAVPSSSMFHPAQSLSIVGEWKLRDIRNAVQFRTSDAEYSYPDPLVLMTSDHVRYLCLTCPLNFYCIQSDTECFLLS